MFFLMNFQFYLEKLLESKDFKKFMKENKNAFLCSGFFAIDREKSDNQQHFDFYVPGVCPPARPKLSSPDGFAINKEKVNDKIKSSLDINNSKKFRSNGMNDQHDKIFSFQLEKEIKKVALERFDEKVPEKVSADFDFDFEEIEQMILERMSKEGIKNKLQKILLSLQRINGKNLITGTVFISGLGMLKVNIDPVQKEIIDFEKKSFFDMVKIVKKGD